MIGVTDAKKTGWCKKKPMNQRDRGEVSGRLYEVKYGINCVFLSEGAPARPIDAVGGAGDSQFDSWQNLRARVP